MAIQHRDAYYWKTTIPYDVATTYIINIDTIFGKRNVFTELMDYVSVRESPHIYIPDSRILSSDISQIIAHILILNPNVRVTMFYDNPRDVPEVLRHFVTFHPPPTDIKLSYLSYRDKLKQSLIQIGFLPPS